MKRTPVHSSMIASVGYDAQEKILEVEFVHNGLIYEYFDVPVMEYHNLMKAASKGNYLQKCIASTYGYGRVSKPVKGARAVQPPPTRQSFSGRYVLTQLLDAGGQPIDAEGKTTLQIEPDGGGNFQLGRLRGRIRGEVTQRDGQPAYRFRWQGKEDHAGASGDGWLTLDAADEAEGQISFSGGDDCSFRARKEGEVI
ncbi:MAG: KTSC domain-containing protein [Cytophagales bacterium]|nr:KTSC domain-containing protein [Cytophagales bacterium]